MAKRQRQVQRPVSFRAAPVRRRGPERANLGRKADRVVGPGLPPPGFLMAWNSKSEWVAYWSIAKALGNPRDPRRGPFKGGTNWSYQSSFGGGRQALGGQVVDFVVNLPYETIGIMLQSDRFHLTTDPSKSALDVARARSLASAMRVEELYERDLITDPTGEQAVKTVVDLFGGRKRMSPKTAGTYRQTRPGRLYGGEGQA